MAGTPPADEHPAVTAWLLDTGPLVAALNRRDPHHARCAAALAGFAGTLLTTGAVVTEAMHFLGGQPEGAAALAGILDDAQVDIRDCFGPTQLHAAARQRMMGTAFPRLTARSQAQMPHGHRRFGRPRRCPATPAACR